LLGDGDTKSEKLCDEENIFCTELYTVEQPRQDKNLLYRHAELNKPIKKGALSYVLLETPFASLSTGSRGHPSLWL
jgi:hypothetical protein